MTREEAIKEAERKIAKAKKVIDTSNGITGPALQAMRRIEFLQALIDAAVPYIPRSKIVVPKRRYGIWYKCGSCGKSVRRRDNFCKHCGAAFTGQAELYFMRTLKLLGIKINWC